MVFSPQGDDTGDADFDEWGLPSGYRIGENSSGDLVIEDTNGNTVFRWDSSAAEWDFESNTLTNIGSVSTEQAVIGVDPSEGASGIQSAVDALPAEGGVVDLHRGTYLFDSTVNINTDNVTIRGDGWDTYLKLADGADAVMFDFTDQDGIHFRDFEIDGNRANQTNDSSTHVQLMKSDGGSDRIRFENIYGHDAVNNCVNAEVFGDPHGQWTVTNCWFDNNYDGSETGYRPGEDLIEFKHCEEAVVTNCYLSGAYKTAVEMERTKYCTVRGNVVRNCSWNAGAIVTETAGANDSYTNQIVSENVTIASNVLKNIHHNAIGVGGGRVISITGNIVEGVPDATNRRGIGCGTLEVQSEEVTIGNNVVYDPPNTSAKLIAVEATSENVSVTGNVAVGGAECIVINDAPGANITGNIAAGGDTRNVNLLSTPGALFDGNTVRTGNGNGIHIASSNVTVQNNHIEDTSTFGVIANSGSLITTRDNIFNNTGAYAVFYEGGTGTVVGNEFKNLSSGIRVASDNNLIKDNVLNSASVLDEGTGNEFRYNDGYATEASGAASVADGGTISHGLAETPTYVNLTTSAQGHIAAASAVDGSSITVQLVDDAGSAIGTAEKVYWEAKAR